MIKILIVSMTLLIAGCDNPRTTGNTYSGNVKFERICVDGVEYLYNGAESLYKGLFAPHMRPDGSLYLCDQNGR